METYLELIDKLDELDSTDKEVVTNSFYDFLKSQKIHEQNPGTMCVLANLAFNKKRSLVFDYFICALTKVLVENNCTDEKIKEVLEKFAQNNRELRYLTVFFKSFLETFFSTTQNTPFQAIERASNFTLVFNDLVSGTRLPTCSHDINIIYDDQLINYLKNIILNNSVEEVFRIVHQFDEMQKTQLSNNILDLARNLYSEKRDFDKLVEFAQKVKEFYSSDEEFMKTQLKRTIEEVIKTRAFIDTIPSILTITNGIHDNIKFNLIRQSVIDFYLKQGCQPSVFLETMPQMLALNNEDLILPIVKYIFSKEFTVESITSAREYFFNNIGNIPEPVKGKLIELYCQKYFESIGTTQDEIIPNFIYIFPYIEKYPKLVNDISSRLINKLVTDEFVFIEIFNITLSKIVEFTKTLTYKTLKEQESIINLACDSLIIAGISTRKIDQQKVKIFLEIQKAIPIGQPMLRTEFKMTCEIMECITHVIERNKQLLERPEIRKAVALRVCAQPPAPVPTVQKPIRVEINSIAQQQSASDTNAAAVQPSSNSRNTTTTTTATITDEDQQPPFMPEIFIDWNERNKEIRALLIDKEKVDKAASEMDGISNGDQKDDCCCCCCVQ